MGPSPIAFPPPATPSIVTGVNNTCPTISSPSSRDDRDPRIHLTAHSLHENAFARLPESEIMHAADAGAVSVFLDADLQIVGWRVHGSILPGDTNFVEPSLALHSTGRCHEFVCGAELRGSIPGADD